MAIKIYAKSHYVQYTKHISHSMRRKKISQSVQAKELSTSKRVTLNLHARLDRVVSD